MPVADKLNLMREVEKDLADVLTASQLRAVMATISTTLDTYDVAQTTKAEGYQFNDMLDTFLSAKSLEGRSAKTIELYRYIISKFLDSVNTPVPKINVYHVRQYLSERKASGISDVTIDNSRSIFRSFFGWLHREGLIERNPMENIAPIKTQKKVRIPYSDVEIQQLKDACKTDRDLALIHFLQATGGRISEVCALDRQNLDFQRRECKVLGKGNKERIVYFDAVTAMVLQRYLASRTDSLSALFIGKGTERIKPGGVRFRLKTIAETAGVENVHPHRFRRTLATSLINHGMPIQEVASILGHEKLDTTMKYITVNQSNVQNDYHRYA